MGDGGEGNGEAQLFQALKFSNLCVVVRRFQAAGLGHSVGRFGESPLYPQ